MAKFEVYRTLVLEVEAEDHAAAELAAQAIDNSEWTDTQTDYAEENCDCDEEFPDDDFDDEEIDEDEDCDCDCEFCKD